MTKPPVCLTIAGLDPSGGAGVIADIKTFSAFGCFAAAAVASLTFQNTTGVFGASHQSGKTVRRQVEPIFADYEVAAVKTGMLPTREVIETVAEIIAESNVPWVVVDPVVRSTSGFDLIDDTALRALIDRLFPQATVVTPNIPEAERISGVAIDTEDDIIDAADVMHGQGARTVLIKGGHFRTGNIARDFLFSDGERQVFESDFIETDATHGTGCTLAAAIAANLALGNDLVAAIEVSKKFVTEAIRTAPGLGKGHSSVNHLVKIEAL
jgi:hydroxymethylpyrimidine/phosphomethylpyrimidine kinase